VCGAPEDETRKITDMGDHELVERYVGEGDQPSVPASTLDAAYEAVIAGESFVLDFDAESSGDPDMSIEDQPRYVRHVHAASMSAALAGRHAEARRLLAAWDRACTGAARRFARSPLRLLGIPRIRARSSCGGRRRPGGRRVCTAARAGPSGDPDDTEPGEAAWRPDRQLAARHARAAG
jgi:hypothetical protein